MRPGYQTSSRSERASTRSPTANAAIVRLAHTEERVATEIFHKSPSPHEVPLSHCGPICHEVNSAPPAQCNPPQQATPEYLYIVFADARHNLHLDLEESL
eukprot:scaffold323_cov94-Isochrysis_galbana.AAC.6